MKTFRIAVELHSACFLSPHEGTEHSRRPQNHASLLASLPSLRFDLAWIPNSRAPVHITVQWSPMAIDTE